MIGDENFNTINLSDLKFSIEGKIIKYSLNDKNQDNQIKLDFVNDENLDNLTKIKKNLTSLKNISEFFVLLDLFFKNKKLNKLKDENNSIQNFLTRFMFFVIMFYLEYFYLRLNLILKLKVQEDLISHFFLFNDINFTSNSNTLNVLSIMQYLIADNVSDDFKTPRILNFLATLNKLHLNKSLDKFKIVTNYFGSVLKK